MDRQMRPIDALFEACERGDDAGVAAALGQGADPNERRSFDDRSPLDVAAAAAAVSSPAADTKTVAIIIDRLAAAGARVLSASPRDGATALHAAAAAGHVGTVKALLRLGAAAGAADLQGQTPLHVLGARRQQQQQGQASSSGTPWVDEAAAIAAALVAAGAGVSALDRAGATPLAAAAGRHNAAAFFALWKAGAAVTDAPLGLLLAGLMRLVEDELNGHAQLKAQVRRNAAALAELRTVDPGLEQLVADASRAAERRQCA